MDGTRDRLWKLVLHLIILSLLHGYEIAQELRRAGQFLFNDTGRCYVLEMLRVTSELGS